MKKTGWQINSGIVILVPVLGALASILVFYFYISATRTDAAFLNVAGRQRMLSQQILVELMLHRTQSRVETHKNLNTLADRFDRSLNVLQYGGQIMDRQFPPAPGELNRYFDDIQPVWKKTKSMLSALPDGNVPPGRAHKIYIDLIKKLPELIHTLRNRSDRLVSAYEAYSNEFRRGILDVIYVVGVLDACLLIFGVMAVRKYISERRKTMMTLRRQADVIDQIQDAVIETDLEGVITGWNGGAQQLFGHDPASVTGKSASSIFSESGFGLFKKEFMNPLMKNGHYEMEVSENRKSGERIFVHLSLSLRRDEKGEPVGIICYAIDTTRQKQAEDQLTYLAHYDHLTDLPNRTLFFDRLKQALKRARWNRRSVGVMFLDLDRFKVINDTMGHGKGDQVLRSAAERLLTSVREGDTVSRLGGDEFAILLVDVARKEDISRIAKKILERMNAPFIIEGREHFVTASIGISIFPEDSDSADILVANADVSMYRAKDLGRNNYQMYSPAMDEGAKERLELENRLRHALELDEFKIHYQPKVDLQTGQITGMEALVRWKPEGSDLIPPARFIPILEETGLIVPVGEWILRTACKQTKIWHEAGHSDLSVAVNLSGRQFNQDDLIDVVDRALKDTGLSPTHLELELTESILMEHLDKTVGAMTKLSDMGIRISIDDFGTGYSSLGYLNKFPIHTLKIDRSFINDIAHDEDSAALTQAIISMAQKLRLTVVAEGVENLKQLQFLQGSNCDEVQGYFFSPPVVPEAFTRLLMQGPIYNPGAISNPKIVG